MGPNKDFSIHNLNNVRRKQKFRYAKKICNLDWNFYFKSLTVDFKKVVSDLLPAVYTLMHHSENKYVT